LQRDFFFGGEIKDPFEQTFVFVQSTGILKENLLHISIYCFQPKKINMNGYTKFSKTNTDPRFPSFNQGFNKRWFAKNCEAVYVCYTTNGVAEALENAIALYGKNVKIKSGGHCYEDFVFNARTKAIIDVTPMNGCGYDPDKGYYLESGGTNWSAFKTLFRDHGKVLPAGSCYSVGLGGHICGGGYGLLSRLNGLTVDWLTGVEVVVKNDSEKPAYSIFVSSDSENKEERDLYWAHRGGGGGNFGVITRYYFKELPDSPASAFITSVSINWNDLTKKVLTRLLDFYTEFSAKKDNWRQFGLLALHHQTTNGSITLTIQTAVMHNEKQAQIKSKYIDPLLKKLLKIVKYKRTSIPAISHLGGFIQPEAHTLLYTFYEAVQILNGSGQNQRGKYKSAYMRKGFTPHGVKTILKYLKKPSGKMDMSQCLLQIDSYGGQINNIEPHATAIPQRSSVLKLQYQAYWANKENDKEYLGWMRKFYTEMYKEYGGTPNPGLDPSDNVDGCYYNYPDSDLNKSGGLEAALHLYFGNNLDRLKQAKKTWDPNNYFNSFQSIPVGE
jgi:FAD/FMN-containing dehydrogenase